MTQHAGAGVAARVGAEDGTGLELAQLRQGLAAHAPRLAPDGPRGRAAVAAVLRAADDGPHLLFIERAHHEGDPWSGDLAFPGGRLEPVDADARAAAVRETEEEVGLDLTPAPCLGRLDDHEARVLPLTVSAFVFEIEHEPDLVPSAEVQAAFWVPVVDLLDDTRRCRQRLERDGGTRHFPAIDLLGPGRPRLWGVTYTFVCQLLRLAGHDLPAAGRS